MFENGSFFTSAKAFQKERLLRKKATVFKHVVGVEIQGPIGAFKGQFWRNVFVFFLIYLVQIGLVFDLFHNNAISSKER